MSSNFRWCIAICIATSLFFLYLYSFESTPSLSYLTIGAVNQLHQLGIKEPLVSYSNNAPIHHTFSRPDVDIEVQGHQIQFNSPFSPKKPKKLRIHLVFHSHVDPGWLKTFEEYYQEQTRNIISSAVTSLTKYPKLRFIWSETSFLERWWRDANQTRRQELKGHVTSGRLEISGGSWVMTDEATPLLYGAVENMIEGHQWVKNQLGVTPNTSWSVDPFGHGSMMPHLLPLAGIDNMVIGRFHEHLKEKLRKQQSLRWRWVGPYSENIASGPRVNSLPHFVYTTHDACPDSQVCQCLHVGPSSSAVCGDDKMVLKGKMEQNRTEYIAEAFVKQMRQVQELYGTDEHLVPIGDDFFFQQTGDFDEMFGGFNSLAEYVNGKKDMHTEIRFSTVSEFFSSIKDQSLPSLRGDFFPYTSNAGKPSPWWTGYFAHRPHSKRIERVLQASLRGMDILRVMSGTSGEGAEEVERAKRDLALFQHHDGITGTSKVHVMEDYEKRMQEAYTTYKNLWPTIASIQNLTLALPRPDAETNVISMKNSKLVYVSVYNSNSAASSEIVRICTDEPVTVRQNDEDLDGQITEADGHFKVSFVASLPPLSITVFELSVRESQRKSRLGKNKGLLGFNDDGDVKEIRVSDLLKQLRISFYTVSDRGAAYVFQPYGTNTDLSMSHFKEEGGPVEQVRTLHYRDSNLNMTLSSSSVFDGLVDISVSTSVPDDKSLLMRVQTDIKNDEFFTDINGMYHVKRTYQSKFFDEFDLPTEANFYPVASSVFIQDKRWRMTLITGQSTAATSQVAGTLDLLVDRVLSGEDGKGLGWQEALDRRSSVVKYKLLFEKRTTFNRSLSPVHSVRGVNEWNKLVYPPVVIYSTEKMESKTFLPFEWPCGIQMVSFRPLNDKAALLVLRRIVYDDTIGDDQCANSMDPLHDWLSSVSREVRHTSLTGTKDGDTVTLESLEEKLKEPFTLTTLRITLPLILDL